MPGKCKKYNLKMMSRPQNFKALDSWFFFNALCRMGDCDIHICKKSFDGREEDPYRSWSTCVCVHSHTPTHTHNKMDTGNKRTTYHFWRAAPILLFVYHSNNSEVSCLLLQILDVEKCLFDILCIQGHVLHRGFIVFLEYPRAYMKHFEQLTNTLLNHKDELKSFFFISQNVT